MNHTHKISKSRQLPFNGVTLHFCDCGARQSSDGNSISGGHNDGTGWYVKDHVNPNREALTLLLNEGHVEGQPTHDPEDYFDVPGNQ